MAKSCEARRQRDGSFWCNRCRVAWDYDDEPPGCLPEPAEPRRPQPPPPEPPPAQEREEYTDADREHAQRRLAELKARFKDA